MSKKNITVISVLKGTVSFQAVGGIRTYKYSSKAIKKILDGRQPTDFKAEEVKQK